MMMMMTTVMTTMFIACLIKKKKRKEKYCLRAEHEMWQSVHWLLPPFVVLYDHILSFGSLWSGPISEPNTLLCVKHWVVDRCVLYRLLNASVFSVSTPQMPLLLCERDSVISVCQMWHVLSFLLHLFNDPDIAMEHTNCTVGHTLSSHGLKSCSTTKPLCMWSSIQKKLYDLSAGVWSF